MAVTTYNPKKVTVALGSHIVTGYNDGAFITIQPNGNGTTYVSGADGEVVRSIDPSQLYIMKLTVLQTSPTNAFLSAKYEADKKNGTGTFSVNVNDILGGEKFVGEVAWVTNYSQFQRAKEQGSREWEIVVYNGQFK